MDNNTGKTGKIIKGIKNKKRDNSSNISGVNSIRSIRSTLKTDIVKKEISIDDNRIVEADSCNNSFVFKHNRSNGNYSVYDGNLQKIQFAIISYQIDIYNCFIN